MQSVILTNKSPQTPNNSATRGEAELGHHTNGLLYLSLCYTPPHPHEIPIAELTTGQQASCSIFNTTRPKVIPTSITKLQYADNAFTKANERMGLRLNIWKTKAPAPTHLPSKFHDDPLDNMDHFPSDIDDEIQQLCQCASAVLKNRIFEVQDLKPSIMLMVHIATLVPTPVFKGPYTPALPLHNPTNTLA
eukprot:g41986.t1